MMFALKRLLVVAVAALAAFCFWPRHSSLRNFDPQKMADIQIRVWKEAAAKNRNGMIGPLYELYSGQYRVPPIGSLMLAIDMSAALTIFATAPDAADQERALVPLRTVYVNLKNSTKGAFDPDVLARMELATWMLQADHAKRAQLTTSISERFAILYGLTAEQCLPAAKHFAQARKNVNESLWPDAGQELVAGWSALKEILATQP